MASRKLTARQSAFVEAYLVSMNATQAAKEAGYSAKTAYSAGERLLRNVEVVAAIDAARAERSERTMIGADRVLRELARIAFLDIAKAFNADGSLKPLSEMDEDTRRAVSGLEVAEIKDADGIPYGTIRKIKLSDKIRALELIGKHVGLFDQKVTIGGDADNPLTLLIKAVQGSSFNPVVIKGDKAA